MWTFLSSADLVDRRKVDFAYKCARGFLAVAALLVGGCAGTHHIESASGPPHVSVGPLLQLLKTGKSHDRLGVVVDRAGKGHVIVAATKSEEVQHIQVDLGGVSGREVIVAGKVPGPIDVVLDREGNLHALLGGSYFVKTGGRWQKTTTPWEAAGMEAESAAFVPGSPDPMWAFSVKGKEVGARGRWDVFGGTAYGGGFILPWHRHGKKLVVVQENPGCKMWSVIDTSDGLNAANWEVASDAHSHVTVIYTVTQTLLGETHETRYVSFDLGKCTTTDSGDQREAARDRRWMQQLNGKPLTALPKKHGFYPWAGALSLSADPESGVAIVVSDLGTWLVMGPDWKEAGRVPVAKPFRVLLAPAGNDEFHAVAIGAQQKTSTGKGFPLSYLKFAGGAWSAPIAIGTLRPSSLWRGGMGAVEIGSDGRNRALVVWQEEERIVGRWLEWSAE